MTKLRDPLTFELAITRIAGLIGWKRCGEILSVAERTIRNWSDPDTAAAISLDKALLLDEAYARAGGEGSPLLECYALRLEVCLADHGATAAAITRLAAAAAKEGGEAIAALIEAAQAGDDDKLFAIAERELEESIAAKNAALSCVRAARKRETA